jgi:hypothetical protein
MRWIMASAILLAAVAVIAGCGGGTNVTPPPPAPVTSPYLGDLFQSAFADPVANIGFVVREDRTVSGAAFFSAPVQNLDVFFSGAVDTSGTLTASGRLVGNAGTQDAGSFTITGTFGNFTDGSNAKGTFTAQGVGAGSGSWRAFIYNVYPLGTYAGTYTGDAQGKIVIMNFAVDDSVIMIQVDDQPRIDYFASDLGSVTLTPPTVVGGPYTVSASNGLYVTGFSLTGTVGVTPSGGVLDQFTSAGTWQQPATPTPLSGTWIATKPAAKAAAGVRGIPPGPIRVHRKRA